MGLAIRFHAIATLQRALGSPADIHMQIKAGLSGHPLGRLKLLGQTAIISSDLTPTWTARSTSEIMSFSMRLSHGSLAMPPSLLVVNLYLSASHSRDV